MELIKKKIHMMVEGEKTISQITLDDDRNVPDNKPDMLRIIDSKGQVVLEDIRANEQQAWIKGQLKFRIMYVGEEEERRIQSLEGSIPFEEEVHMEGLKAGESIRAEAELEDLRVGIINSRKMSIQSIITLKVAQEKSMEEEMAVDVLDKQEAEFYKSPMEIMELRIQKKDMLRIREEILLPSGKSNIYELIWDDVSFNVKEIRLLQGKIYLCGSLQVFVLYTGEGGDNKSEWLKEEIAVTKELECNGCSEEMIPEIHITLKSCDCEVKTDEDAEERILALDAVLDMDIKIYEEELLELVQDLYSTKKELKPDVKRCKFQSLIGNNITKCRLNHKVRIKKEEPRILQICNGSGRVRVDQIEKIEKGILVEGTLEVSVLYVSAEDELPFFAKQIQIPFVQKIDIHEMKENTDYKVETGNIQINTTMIDSEEMEIKAVVDLAVKAVEHIWQNVITQVSEEPLDLQRLEGLAGIVVYVVKENDSLWSIGKNYCMSVSDIRELNGLESDVIQKNDRLILCKSPGNITK